MLLMLTCRALDVETKHVVRLQHQTNHFHHSQTVHRSVIHAQYHIVQSQSRSFSLASAAHLQR